MLNRPVVVATLVALGFVGGGHAAAQPPAEAPLMNSAVFSWESLAANPTKIGAVRRVVRAPTATLDELESHITTLNPGQSPHPPHQHANEEVLIVKEGAVEAWVEGAWVPAPTGSTIFFASNHPHTVRNVGTVPATYHVLNWKSARTGQVGAAAGYFEASGDVGRPALAGSTTYDAATQRYTLIGGGTNMWGTRDEFQFAWRRLSGDFIVRTHAAFVGQGVDPHRKLGLIIRRSLDADSPYVDAAVHGDGLTSLQFRKTMGGTTEQIQSAVKAADVIQLERRGRTFIMSVARFGDPFTTTEVADVDLGDEVYAGLFLCSHNPAVIERATFTNVRIVVPPKAGWVPYRDYIGSNLEVLTVATGERSVLLTSPVSIQAPNWTTDGAALIYNGGGRLHRFDLAARTTTPIDTGFATANNNDHVLSFDGKQLAISHHAREDGNRSVIYTVPTTGGVPKRVTPKSPSYLHGWSADARHLVYTGVRDGEHDIYKIPVEGGEEVRLTTAPGVDDGPEYTPDGRWIYFNSMRTGRMQIWRMRPDGSAQEQITNDGFNNWFPHISPDGRSIAFLSYGDDVAPADHPFYRQVYLRVMKPDGTEPRVVAYVYGGQGTINVPSWSPDSTRLGFVSNTALPAPYEQGPGGPQGAPRATP